MPGKLAEGDLATFVHIKNHFKSSGSFATALFTPATRSDAVRSLYEAAAKTPVCVMREMDRLLNQDGRRTSAAEIFICTPVLGQTRRRMRCNIDVEIETRMPAAIEDLRKWTSLEAIGDITVTPDCVARVGFGGQLNTTDMSGGHPAVVVTPCTPPSGDEDEPDDITVINSYSRAQDTLISASPTDMPLDHRLPSPEEQCQILAQKFPAEVVSVDISGKRFDRMCHTRKSLLHTQVPGSATDSGVSSPPSDSVDNQTVKRRSRPKKPRGKRRNTLAGTDQKEIQEAANGEPETVATPDELEDLLAVVPRSKSSDILKRDPFAVDTGRTLSTHFNSLKQWGMNRLRMMNRNMSEGRRESAVKSSDIDDFNVHESIGGRNRRKVGDKDRKLSHERKPSYSSSEKSISIASPASINPVKLRETSSIRRQRRVVTRDEPNSSSGNWSASSESGRTSIGSEITAQPKSSASSNSLNHNHHPGSGPPSSIISRRRFLNTSASSSVTSEGTATPDLQGHEMFYDDGETSSAYSCDTEGYYTSFHVDSGLKTLKEEEPVTPLHTSSALSSTNSFSSSGNQTVLSAENEYELFGRGSTSTTTSSAGTVCTTLKAAGSDRSLIVGPTVPERKSSLTKLNRSSSTNSGGTLERSYSSSTSVGSTLERTGTIKRNGVLLQKEVAAIVHQHQQEQQKETRTDSPDSGNNTSSSPVESNSNSSPTQGVRSYSEFEYSESSDLEGVDRIERIRSKTTINSSRIPSMCVITPTNSDDEYQTVIAKKKETMPQRPKLEVPLQETDLDALEFNTASEKANSDHLQIITVNQSTGYATVQTVETPKNAPTAVKPAELKKEVQYVKKTTLLPLNSMFGRLKGVLPTLGKLKSPQKDTQENSEVGSPTDPDVAGEYVTIADVKNNNKAASGGVYYSNDVVKRNLATVLSGNLAEETEYVSLNELPANMRCESNLLSSSITSTSGEKKIDTETESDARRGARVMLDAQGKVVYSSDSLKRRKGAHTTFAPGPCVKDTTQPSSTTSSPTTVVVTPSGLSNRKPTVVRPVPAINPTRKFASENQANTANEPVKEVDETTNTVVGDEKENNGKSSTSMFPTGSLKASGAYVHLQCDEDTYLPPPPPPMLSDPSGYLPLYHEDNRTHLATLPRAPVLPAAAVYETVGAPYWTLQARKPPVEALYSTPNKPKKTPLKTTPLGFETFFSPVKETTYRMEESPIESPIDPRSGERMRTSTPSRNEAPLSPVSKPNLADELRSKLRIHEGIRSNGNSPSSSGRSTPRGILEPQGRGRHSWASDAVEIPQTCSDRLGTPKTSLMDFKKLLLAKAGKSATLTKPSAVEQLLKKPTKTDVPSPVKPAVLNTSLKIQDLSGSPKTFANRRMIRQGNFGGSPAKAGLSGAKHMSPRSANWRLNSAKKHDVMSTSIPEANSEEDNSSSPGNSTRRSSVISAIDDPPLDIKAETKNVVEEIVKMKDNIFLKAEENNFMKHEMLQKTPSYTTNRSQMIQAQRAQFLMGLNPAQKGSPTSGNSPEPSSNKAPPSLETAL
ncbi:SCAR/WAVE family [Sergentomyia squamirostris]